VQRWSVLIVAQRDATQSSLFIILQVHSTCFGCQPQPSSGVHETVTTASGTVQLPPSNVAKLAWPRWREVAAQNNMTTIYKFYVYGSMHRWSILIIVQRDATQSSLFIILQVHSTCFQCQPHPSSGVHKTVTTASGTVQLPPSNMPKLAWPLWKEVAAKKKIDCFVLHLVGQLLICITSVGRIVEFCSNLWRRNLNFISNRSEPYLLMSPSNSRKYEI